jgi:hypothetical protein
MSENRHINMFGNEVVVVVESEIASAKTIGSHRVDMSSMAETRNVRHTAALADKMRARERIVSFSRLFLIGSVSLGKHCAAL